MRLKIVCMLAGVLAAAVSAASELSLQQAFERVLADHPDLAQMPLRARALRSAIDEASQPPPLEVAIELENALGNRATRGLQDAELTLSLSSVLERGGKRGARGLLAQETHAMLDAETAARRLDLLAETARRYLAVTAAAARCAIAKQSLDGERKIAAAAAERARAGAGTQADQWSGEALVARREMELDQCAFERSMAMRQLGALWGEPRESGYSPTPLPDRLPELVGTDQLLAGLGANPELARFVTEMRLREARLQLARTAANADIRWQLGLRRLETTDSFGLQAGVSLPLGSRARATPRIDAAIADLERLALERESTDRRLEATLLLARDQYLAARDAAGRWRNDVIPRLDRAGAAAEAAYRQGGVSALLWRSLQNEVTGARLEELDARLRAHQALIELERLTGLAVTALPLAAAAAPSSAIQLGANP